MTRARTAKQDAILASSNGYASYVRVRVFYGTSGGYLDLTDIDGENYLRKVEYSETVDQPVNQATVTFAREIQRKSLSRLRGDSVINGLAGGALISEGREFVIESAIAYLGTQPVGSDWIEVFRGDIDEIDLSSDPASFIGYDLGKRLQDLIIEFDREHGSTSGVPVQTVMQECIDDAHGKPFAISEVLAVEDTRTPTARNGYFYVVSSVTGTATTGAQPTWPTIIGSTVTTGGVTFQCAGTIPTLYTPVNPNWNIGRYIQKQESAMDACRNLALQIGWDVRYKWRNSTNQFELTFFQPDAAKTAIDWTWSPDKYYDVKEVKLSRADVRTRIVLPYSDINDKDVTGTPKRKQIVESDKNARLMYGGGRNRTMIINEGSTSNINTEVEARKMAKAALAALKDPLVDQTVEADYFPFGELGDLYRFSPNGVHYNAAQDLAVVGLTHVLDVGESTPSTNIQVRGKPTGPRFDYLKMETRTGKEPPIFTPPLPPTNLVSSKVPSGIAVQFTPPAYDWFDFEIHASLTPGFTPTAGAFPASGTLIQVSRSNRVEIGSLVAGRTYYIKVIPRDLDGNRGPASAELTLVAGDVTPGMLRPNISWGDLPLNRSFEAHTDTSTFPDGWSGVGATVWGTHILTSTDSHSGSRSLYFPVASITRGIQAQLFYVNPGDEYIISVWTKQSSTAANAGTLNIEYFTSDMTVLGGYGKPLQEDYPGPVANEWRQTRELVTIQSSSNVRYARVSVRRTAASVGTLYLDSVDVLRLVGWSPWIPILRTDGTDPDYDFGFENIVYFNTGWRPHGTSTDEYPQHARPAYRYSTDGQVELRGICEKYAYEWTIAFFLPPHVRPQYELSFTCEISGNPGIIRVRQDGGVGWTYANSGAHGFFIMDPIRYTLT